MSACAKVKVCRCALGLLDEMRERELKPNVISLNAAMSACEKGGVWRCAFGLLEEMREVLCPALFSGPPV